MSIKLRQIEIDSFRAYKDRQIFDFYLGNNKIANFVAIFAPNGFGKTSFFDAIEWSFTGEIDRIEKIPSVTLSNHGHLLKNVDSKKEQGEIKFVANNNEEYIIKTKKLGLYNRKSDYSSGDVVTKSASFSNIVDSKFSLTNILAHDKIDTFLKFSSQKDRYETLSLFWDDNNDSSTYKKIINILNEIAIKESEIRSNISLNEKEIKELIYVENKITYINEIIQVFNKVSLNYNDNLNEINSNMTIEDINNFLFKCHELKSELSETERNANKNTASVALLQEFFPKYINDKNKSKELDKENTLLSQIVNAFLEKEKREVELIQIQSDIKKINDRIDKINVIRNNFDKYSVISNEIELLNKNVYEHSNNLTMNTQRSIGIENENNVIKEMIRNYSGDYEKVLEKALKVDDKAIEFAGFINSKIKLEKRLNLMKRVLAIREDKDMRYNESLNKFESILRHSNEVLLSDESLVLLNPVLNDCKLLNDQLIDLKKKLKVTEDDIEKQKRLSSDIEELLRSGSNLVLSLSASNCPLCKAKYNNHIELIQRINMNIKTDVELQRLASLSNDLNINIKQTHQQIELNFENFKRNVRDQINILSNEKNLYFNKIINCRSVYEKITYKKNILEEKIKALNLFIKEDIETVGEINSDVFNQLRNALNYQANKLLENIKREQKESDAKTKEFLSLKLLIEESHNAIRMSQLKVNECRANPEYVIMQEIIKEFSIDSSLDGINKAYLVEEENKGLEGKKIDKIITEIESLKNICGNYEHNVIHRDLLDLNGRTEENIKEIFNYEIQFKELFINTPLEKLSADFLTIYQEDQQRNSNQIGESIKNIETIVDHLEYIEQNKNLKTKQSNLIKLNCDLEKIIQLKTSMNEAREIGKSFLENKINLAFNHRMINDIYNKIDPHPDLSIIEFKPDFSKDKMDINVTACGSDNNERSPVLYFSSAQLNILSLSIFLARTIQSENLTLNTIFMDDPIQHLDSINILSFIDLIRTITTDLDRQIIISTHNINFFNLLKRKLNPEFYDSKFIELSTYGSLK